MASADVLSQSEIDELLAALSTGTVSAEEIAIEESKKKIKTYNFRRPDKFSKDQIRTLYMLHENFARLLNTYLSAHLRTMVHVNVVSVDQLTYEEFIRSMSSPTVISVFQMRPLQGSALMEINHEIAFAIIDRLAGGSGSSLNKNRALTDIEQTIISRITNKALDSFKEAWKQVIDITPKLDTIETNPQFTQIVPPNDMVVIIAFQAKIMNTEGTITFAIPYLVLEPIMSKLTTTFWVSAATGRQERIRQDELIQKRIEKTKIPLSVNLGCTNITVRELLGLVPGDVLVLDRKHSSDLDIIVGKREKFKCKPGLVNNKLAVQITSVASEEEDGNG